jgi:hypothetical protein
MFLSMALALLGEGDFRYWPFSSSTSAVDDLKKAIAVSGNISISVRMYRRFSRRHENPILTLYVRR